MNAVGDFSFGASGWLWALLLVPALAFLFILAERRTAARLSAFVAPRLLPQLGATINRFRRTLRFALLLLGIALAVVALARPRLGYTYEEVKRKGLDLIIAIDTSRSMLANDVPPNRLQRVKLSAHDLIGELRGDRIGLIAFAGRAFLQAPLTIDYDAAAEALNDFDTEIIPEGGSNIAEAITLAVKTFGKSATGNRALIIFTDGEELAGEAVKAAQSAADAGVRIFTVGVGTPEGSFIPLPAQGGGTAFVKDTTGEIVKSKLDEGRLREVAQLTGGMYLPLGNGPAAMRQLYEEGLAKMQAGEIDTKMSRQPIERYQWPLGTAILALIASILITERKREPRRVYFIATKKTRALATASIIILSAHLGFATAPGLEAYRKQEYSRAYEEFRQTLEKYPNTRAKDKIEFDAGAAAYKMKDYGKALQSFSQALLSRDPQLQSRSHYNLGNTLYQRGETQKSNDEKLKDWTNALQHYEQTLKLEPENKEAKENAEFVKKKIEELKKEQEQQPPPTPTPSPSPSPQPQDKKEQQQQEEDKDKQQQQQDRSGDGDSNKPEQGDPSQQQKEGDNDQQQNPTPSPTATPTPPGQQRTSPTPGSSPSAGAAPTPAPSPSPDPGSQASPSPSANGSSASPSPGDGDNSAAGSSPTPAPTPASTPGEKPTGDVKGAGEDQSQEQAEAGAEAEPVEEGQMSEQQAERLLQAMKDEEARVQLDERKRVRRVYKDW